MSEFARLKPRELLMATEKSMLNGQLLNLHLQLIDRKKELNDQEHVRHAPWRPHPVAVVLLQ